MPHDNTVDLGQLFESLRAELMAKLNTIRKNVNHPAMMGDGSEAGWIEVLRSYLPYRYGVEKGVVVDSTGRCSEQQDIIIYDRQYSPFILNKEGVKYLAAESVYAVVEAKQVLDKGYVEYAAGKAASVRQLHRTSVAIQHAGGTYKPKTPFRIPAGVVTLDSDWSPPLGTPFESALDTIGKEADRQLDFGCVLGAGGFVVQYDEDGNATTDKSSPEAALMFFLLKLFERLQSLGTVAAIDVDAYAKWLSARSQTPVVAVGE